MSMKCELFFFILDARGDLLILLHGDRVILGLIFNCVISTFIFNRVTRNFC